MADRPNFARLPVPAGEPAARQPQAPASGRTDADPRFTAHLQGQFGQRRGLRGGPPVLQAARSLYLRTEWAGRDDRRAAPGSLRREAI